MKPRLIYGEFTRGSVSTLRLFLALRSAGKFLEEAPFLTEARMKAKEQMEADQGNVVSLKKRRKSA